MHGTGWHPHQLASQVLCILVQPQSTNVSRFVNPQCIADVTHFRVPPSLHFTHTRSRMLSNVAVHDPGRYTGHTGMGMDLVICATHTMT
jgi:hypothetical protein